jgi:hypothetical protein
MKKINLIPILLLFGVLLFTTNNANAYIIKYHKDFWGSVGLRNTFSKVETKAVAHLGADGSVVVDQVDVYCKGRGGDDCEANLSYPPRPEQNSYPELEATFANNMVERATTHIINGTPTGTFNDVLVIAKSDGTLVTINFVITWTANIDGSADFDVERIENNTY